MHVFCIFSSSAQLSMFHMERHSKNTIIIGLLFLFIVLLCLVIRLLCWWIFFACCFCSFACLLLLLLLLMLLILCQSAVSKEAFYIFFSRLLCLMGGLFSVPYCTVLLNKKYFNASIVIETDGLELILCLSVHSAEECLNHLHFKRHYH